MVTAPRIQEGDRVRHCDGREGVVSSCVQAIVDDCRTIPFASVMWESGGQDVVPLGYLEVIPGVKVTP